MKLAKAEVTLLLAVFLDLLGFGMIIPDIQLRAESLCPPGWPVGLVVGALLASTFITQTLVSPRWGALSDRRGRKPILLICTILSGFAMGIYAMANSLLLLLVSRLCSGFGAANLASAQALLADMHEGESRTPAMGRIGAAVSTGLIMGPVLGGELAHRGGNLLVGSVACAASLVGALAIAVFVPHVRPVPREEDRSSKPKKSGLLSLGPLRELPALRPLALTATVAWFSLATLEGTFGRLLQDLFGYGQREFGLLFGYESLLGVITQVALLSWLVARLRERNLLWMSYLAQGVGLALTPLAITLSGIATPLATLFVASTLYALGSSLANPTINSLCSRLTPAERQGELFGLLQGTRSIGFVVGPLLGGILFDWRPWAPYALAGAVCLVAAWLIHAALRPTAVDEPVPTA